MTLFIPNRKKRNIAGYNAKEGMFMSIENSSRTFIKGPQILAVLLASLLFLSISGLAAPGITLQSYTVLVDGVPATQAKEGSILTFNYVVRNSGSETLTNVQVEDTRNYPSAGIIVTQL
jgi:hypothetical protein